MMPNINDYNSIPPTPYRLFLDDIQRQIAYTNSLSCPDSDRLEILRGALVVLLSDDTDSKTIEQRVVDSYPDDQYFSDLNAVRKSQCLEPVSNGKWYAMFEDRGLHCIAYGGFDTEDEARAMFGERVNYAMCIPLDKLVIYPDYRKVN